MPSAKTGSYQIVDVETKKTTTICTLDNGEKLTLSANVAADFYLYRLKTITDTDVQAIKVAQAKRSLFEYALKKMRGKYLSEATVISLLFDFAENKSYIAAVIKELKQKHYIDDEKFALQVIERGQHKYHGNDLIERELKKQRIHEEVIQHIELSEADEYERGLTLVPLLEKKLVRTNFRQKKDKIYQQLVRLGYHRDVIHRLLDTLSDVDTEVEMSLLKKDFDKAYKRYGKKYEKQELFRHLLNYLLTKGYTYKDIKVLWEEHDHDMD